MIRSLLQKRMLVIERLQDLFSYITGSIRYDLPCSIRDIDGRYGMRVIYDGTSILIESTTYAFNLRIVVEGSLYRVSGDVDMLSVEHIETDCEAVFDIIIRHIHNLDSRGTG